MIQRCGFSEIPFSVPLIRFVFPLGIMGWSCGGVWHVCMWCVCLHTCTESRRKSGVLCQLSPYS